MKTIATALGIGIVLAMSILAYMLGTRMDQNTMSMIGGTLIGLVVSAPVVCICVFVTMRVKMSPPRQDYDPGYRMQAPPQYWVQPPTEADQLQQPYQPYTPAPRKFYTIGMDGQPSQIGGTTEIQQF
jgi:hypothetical protein